MWFVGILLVLLLCFFILPKKESFPVGRSINKVMINVHNELRHKLHGPGYDLRYDSVLASRAQKWADWLATNVADTDDGWNGGHPPDYGGDELCRQFLGAPCASTCTKKNGEISCSRNGQNVCTFSNYKTRCIAYPDQAVHAWFNEIHEPEGKGVTCKDALYKGGNIIAINGTERAECGHFSQLAWKGAKKIGCGMAEGRVGTRGTRMYFVCNYDQGNVVDQDLTTFVKNLPDNCAPEKKGCPPLIPL